MKSLIGIGAFLFTLILSMGAISSCGGGGGDTVTKATVSGTVLDSNGNPIVAALVTITSTPLTTNTDPVGYFSAEIEVGDHTITFSVGSYIVSQYDFTVSDESPVDLGDLEPTNPYYPGGATWYKDIDGDLYSDGISAQSEIPLDGYDLAANLTGTTDDCDDSNDQVNPGAAEVCNSIDDNCVGGVDEGVTTTFYADTDTDTYGDPLATQEACVVPADYVADNNDCDDNDPGINPGAAEVCNSIDDNCDGSTDEGLTFDVDTDGFTSIGSCFGSADDCDDSDSAVNPGAAEVCNSIDDNCDGSTDEGLTFDVDTDGFTSIGSCSGSADDCDDFNDQVNPGATDIPGDGIDQDCDGIDATNLAAFIDSGCFDMGDAFGEGNSNELPVHRVCITTGFYMDVHEVTNAEYKMCVDAGGCDAPSNNSSDTRTTYYGDTTYDDFPVIYVDWNKALDYCAWEGKRLPTEAEWEYAARGGLSGMRYPNGDAISGTDANYMNSGDTWDNDTSQVEYHAPNGYGLYDMAGNVHEWTSDWYSDVYYSESPVNDPQGPVTGTRSVLRGGSWDDPPYSIRDSVRHADYHNTSWWNVGFRCVSD